MLFVRASQAAVLITVLAINPAFASRTHRAATSGHQRAVSSKKSRSVHFLHKLHGQRSIDPARATQIQQALIKQNYLSGSPSGLWDSTTEAAMQKYQSDHGWQTKLMPDSRALISLGLGPNHAGEGTQASNPVRNLPTVSEAGSESGDGNTLASVHSIPSP